MQVLIAVLINQVDQLKQFVNVCAKYETKKAISENRAASKRKQEEQAEAMLAASKRKLNPADIGDNVTVRIPEFDRGRGDHSNILAVVLSEHEGMYKLGTRHGKLEGSYSRNQFGLCEEKFLTSDEVPDKQISLRSAANLESVGTGQGFFKCNCKTNCEKSHRCKCKKAGKLCNSKCHSSKTCGNK